MQQIDNLAWLVRELKRKGVHVMLYTGYELEEIEADPAKKELCQIVDILIPGRYREEVRDTNLLWRGSRNQPLIYLSGENDAIDANQVEITIDDKGAVTCLGYPSDDFRIFIQSLE